jgi:hypothetical protein
VNVIEYRLDSAFRRQYAYRAVGQLVLVVLLAVMGRSTGLVAAMVFAAIVAVSALFHGAMWAGRRRALTRIDASGIETRVFRSKRIAWADVKEIRVFDFERTRRVGVTGGFVGANGRRNSGGGNKKVACVKIVRHRGRSIELAAPLVTRDGGDSKFDDKVRALRAAREFHLKADAAARATAASR